MFFVVQNRQQKFHAVTRFPHLHWVSSSNRCEYPCFLCLWDNRADKQHYVQREWPSRHGLEPGSHNVQSRPLIEPQKILPPPLHIKLGLMKNFVKVLDKGGRGFAYLGQKFPRVSREKLKAGVFDGPQIRKFIKTLNSKNVWNSLNSLHGWPSRRSSQTSWVTTEVQSTRRLSMSWWTVFINLVLECRWKCTFSGLMWTTFCRTMEISVINRESVSIRTSRWWRNIIKAGGITFWQTIASAWRQMSYLLNTIGNTWKDHLFLISLYYRAVPFIQCIRTTCLELRTLCFWQIHQSANKCSSFRKWDN